MRAVDPGAAAIVAGWARARDRPLHAHVSEQPAENRACLEAYGGTPTAVLAEAGALAARFTAVHATHLEDADVTLLGGAGACCCVCPTTERDLADGIGRMSGLAEAGASLALGSDSHAAIDLFEEARAVELDERLASGERGHHTAAALLRAASEDGHACLGWPDAGRIAPGREPTSSRSRSPACAWPAPSRRTRSRRSCSRRAPATYGTCSLTAARSSPTAGTPTIDVARELHEAILGVAA